MTEKFDVLVLGAGPAGLAAARSAATEGAKTLVLEMRARVGGQLNFENLLPGGAAREFKKAVVTDIGEVKINSPHENLTVKGKIAKLVDREKLCRILAAETISSGAEIWINAPARGLLVKKGTVKGVKASSGAWSEEVNSEVTIDASGSVAPWSSIFLRETLGEGWRPEQTAYSNEYLMTNAEKGAAEIYFSSYLAPGGRAWVYPFGEKQALAGIFGVRIHPDTALDEFLGKFTPKTLVRAAPIATSRGQIPLQGPLNQTCGDGIIAVGGAAGQICPLSGQGLRYALGCGAAAGRVAVDAITDENVSKDRLSEYDRAWRTKFGWEFQACNILRSSLTVAQDRKMDELLRVAKKSLTLRRALLNLLTNVNLKDSMKSLLKSDEVIKILGQGVKGKVLKLV